MLAVRPCSVVSAPAEGGKAMTFEIHGVLSLAYPCEAGEVVRVGHTLQLQPGFTALALRAFQLFQLFRLFQL